MWKALLLSSLIFAPLSVSAQSVKGKVKDAATGEPLMGVTIRSLGNKKMAVTDIDGNYTIEASGKERLRFSYIGYDDADVTVDGRNVVNIGKMVKEKTGRAMQTKEREKVNKKTGKVTIVRGSTPLKEGVVVIKDNTTMEQLRHFCEVCKERWGITPLQVFIHRDEGHYSNPQDPATWKPNLYAHIVWDWMNHDTGKSYKLNEKAMSEMQTLLAECLEMERGVSKELTGKKHLERTDFIIAKQKQEAEQAKAEKEAALSAKEEAEAERASIEVENKAKAERNLAL